MQGVEVKQFLDAFGVFDGLVEEEPFSDGGRSRRQIHREAPQGERSIVYRTEIEWTISDVLRGPYPVVRPENPYFCLPSEARFGLLAKQVGQFSAVKPLLRA